MPIGRDHSGQSWVAVDLALATAARFRFDEDEFNQRLSAASWFRDSNPDIEHRIHHEKCLWAIFALDFEALEDLLSISGARKIAIPRG